MKPIQLREADFKRLVWEFSYPESIKQEFFEYWTEPNKSGTKMRFELEKTWHLGRRIARWANNGFGVKTTNNATQNKQPVMAKKEPQNDFEKLDLLLEQYLKRHESVSSDQFAEWYDFLKREHLMRQFSKQDVQIIKDSYGDDVKKCRAACVKMTFDSYLNTGLRFSDIAKMRENLNA